MGRIKRGKGKGEVRVEQARKGERKERKKSNRNNKRGQSGEIRKEKERGGRQQCRGLKRLKARSCNVRDMGFQNFNFASKFPQNGRLPAPNFVYRIKYSDKKKIF